MVLRRIQKDVKVKTYSSYEIRLAWDHPAVFFEIDLTFNSYFDFTTGLCTQASRL
jgi:hypothetical protein